MSKKIEKLQGDMQQAWEKIDAIRQKVVAEDREFMADERDQVEKGLDVIRNLEKQVEEARKDEDILRQVEAFGEGLKDAIPAPVPTGTRKGAPLSEQFLGSPQFKSWLAQMAPGGTMTSSQFGRSPAVELKGFLDILHRKQLVTGLDSTSAGAFIVPDDTGIYEPLGRHPLTLPQLISRRQTDTDTVEWVVQTGQITQAAPVPEANVVEYTGYPGQVQGLKPLGAPTFERVQTTVKNVAVAVKTTRRALADVSQMRGILEQELREDLAEELELQMLAGNGIGENFTGLANTANTLGQTFDTDIFRTSHKALTHLLVNGKQRPTAWLLSPEDWETIELSKDNQGRYHYGGPINRGPMTLWGVPVALSFFQTAGTGWLGNWTKAVLWDRQLTSIYVTDSDVDDFRRNIITILAEFRAAFGITLPSAFCEVDLEGGS
jgi:HK97 family phage major capsid protein